MGLFAKNVRWMVVLVVAGILSLGAPGRVLGDDDGKTDSTAKTDASGTKAEKKEDTPAALTERERMLLDRVELLERRVEELEAKSGAKTTTPNDGDIAANGKSSSTNNLADTGRSNAVPLHICDELFC